MNRKTLGAWMIAIGIACAAIGYVLWESEEDRVEQAEITNEFSNALSGFDIEDGDANHLPSYGLWAVGALLVLAGVVFVAGSHAPAGAGPVGPQAASPVNELARLVEMRDAGTISEEEFEAAKRRALGL